MRFLACGLTKTLHESSARLRIIRSMVASFILSGIGSAIPIIIMGMANLSKRCHVLCRKQLVETRSINNRSFLTQRMTARKIDVKQALSLEMAKLGNLLEALNQYMPPSGSCAG